MPDNSYSLDPPFNRGWVYGRSWGADGQEWEHRDSPSATDGDGQRQREKRFPDINPITGAVLSNQIVTCVAVKNDTGGTVAAGDEVSANGYDGLVDEYLQKDVPADEIFWLVIDGPVTTDFTSDPPTRTYYADGGVTPPEIP